MNKKIYIQLSLFLIIVLIAFFTFYFYFSKNNKISVNQNDKDPKIIESSSAKNDSLNIIKDLEYLSTDNEGNEYKIFSELGEVNVNDPDIINMQGVIAVIKMKNAKPITIKSDFAEYNNKTYDTKFRKNVLVLYIFHTINAENLDLFFQDNVANMYNEIVYKNMNTKLFADRLEIDLITKNSRIFMNNETKKIKLFTKQ
ncbi:LPS export ABC transporter periplasmic protein LptC [Candidatus Pelagibacter sp.]|nr:LPS export ABC transporter periplasmic protein LptC [Candidatus Pelagibacter sp.]|tara:strand:+ start:472 stop:1068 length:597 start_codon:yes stop_codon:yes gene_type:complete